MTLLDSNDREWQYIIEFLATKYPSVLDFAERLSKTEYSKTWFPSTSMGALVLSPSPNYEDRWKNPLIAVNGSSDDSGRVSLEVWTRYGDSNSLSRFKLAREESFERLISFLESYEKSRRASPE